MRRAVQVMLRWLPRDGISLVEVIVALMLLGGGMIAVTSAGSAVISQLKTARTEVEGWAALQSVADSLQQFGYGNVASGTRVDGRYNFLWTVYTRTPGTRAALADPQLRPNEDRIELGVWATEPVLWYETLHIYLADF